MHFNSGEYNAANERTKRKREPFSTVPFSRDPDFVDRPNISAWIYEKCAGPATRRCREVAARYSILPRCQRGVATDLGVLGARKHQGTVRRRIQRHCGQARASRRNDPAINVLQLVRGWLRDEANDKWTMVLDNVDDIEVFYPKRKLVRGDSQDMPAPLAAFLPQSHNGSILITSRSKDAAVRLAGSYKNIKEVHAVDRGQALQLFRNKLEDASDEGGAADLLNNLDYIPLAIT